MNITEIKCFCAVVKYNSFSKAAEELYMSQSSVSKYVASFEKQCGFPLIIRKKKDGQINLTAEGQLILRDCNRIIADYDDFLHLKNEMKKQPLHSELSFSLQCVPEMSYYGILQAISNFNNLIPNVSVHLVEAQETHARVSLINNECDLAFITDIDLDPEQYKWQAYRSEKFSAIVSADSPLAIQNEIYMQMLNKYSLITGIEDSNLFKFCLETCQKSKFEPVFDFMTSRVSIAVEYISFNTSSVCILPSEMLKYFQISEKANKNYKILKIVDSPVFNYVFAWKKGKKLNDSVKKFLKLTTMSESEVYIKNHLDFSGLIID